MAVERNLPPLNRVKEKVWIMNEKQSPTTKKQKDKQKNKKPFNIYKLFTIILLIVLLVVIGVLVRNWYVQNQAEKQYEDLAAQINQLQNSMNDNAITVPSGTEEAVQEADTQEDMQNTDDSVLTQLGISVPQKTFDWDALHAVNPDIYAWICIPGTNIDYPILQNAKDDNYYLRYNMNGTKGYPGCIYTEKINSKDFTDFDTVVYGHNMRDDTMFATLHYFEDSAFFANCPYVYVYTEDKVLVYEIFAAYESDNLHILYSNDFTTVSGRQIYLDKIYNMADTANVRSDVQATEQGHVLTLSTCIKGKSENRFLVQAVLLNEDEL